MIESRTFLGLSLTGRRRRRRIVIAYYALLTLLVAFTIYKHKLLGGAFIIQTISIGGLFGGIRSGGPVKRYTEPGTLELNREVQQLNLTERRPFAALDPLDEREIAERDDAHFIAYRILYVTIGIVFFGSYLATVFDSSIIARDELSILWFLTVFAISLPKSVILWTEPDPVPERSMELVLQP